MGGEVLETLNCFYYTRRALLFSLLILAPSVMRRAKITQDHTLVKSQVSFRCHRRTSHGSPAVAPGELASCSCPAFVPAGLALQVNPVFPQPAQKLRPALVICNFCRTF